MRIESMKFYEGFNITGQEHTIRLIVWDISALEAEKYANKYIQICQIIGFSERILEIKKTADEITLWMSYSQEEVSEFIWIQIERGQTSCEAIARDAHKLVRDKVLDDIAKEAKLLSLSFMRVSKDSYQIGYGSSSVRFEEHDKERVLDFIKGRTMKNIPVFAVTGTNGKTTTARLLYHMFMRLGYNAGLANTGSIMVGKDRLETGDTTGFQSSRTLLSDKRVEAVVLETARGGIIKSGLGYEEIHGAIITSLSEDHLGLLGVNNVEELAAVKAVVLKGVMRGGAWVLKAQSEILEIARKNLYYENFSQKALLYDIHKNSFIEEHISSGGEAMYVQGSYLIHYKNGIGRRIADVNQISFTHGGLSWSNVLNVMAVLLALGSIGKEMSYLVSLISKIPCDIIHNPGRQNILEVGGVKVIIDYGHNAEAYKAVYSIVEGMKPTKVTSIITAPGDRQDKHIKELGYISGTKSGHIIIREQRDGRGSERGRVESLMTWGACSAGRKNEEISYESDAGEALVHALERAAQGEVIVIFTEYLQPVIERLNEYIKSSKKGDDIPIPQLSL
jgi:UDP-N-acetylmuramyl tripeptide synthase